MAYVNRDFPVYNEHTILKCEQIIKDSKISLRNLEPLIMQAKAESDAAYQMWLLSGGMFKNDKDKTHDQKKSEHDYYKKDSVHNNLLSQQRSLRNKIQQNEATITQANKHINIRDMPEIERLNKFWSDINEQINRYLKDRPAHCLQRTVSIHRIRKIGQQIMDDQGVAPGAKIDYLAGLLLNELDITEGNHNHYTALYSFTESNLAHAYVQAFKQSIIEIESVDTRRYTESKYYEPQPHDIVNPKTTFWSRNKGKTMALGTIALGVVLAGLGIALSATGVLAGIGIPLSIAGAALILGGAGLTIGTVSTVAVVAHSVHKQNRPSLLNLEDYENKSECTPLIQVINMPGSSQNFSSPPAPESPMNPDYELLGDSSVYTDRGAFQP